MDVTWVLDPATGELVVEGLSMEEASALAGDLLALPQEVNCARPLTSLTLLKGADSIGPTVRVARIYHGSLVDGPGRRSVVQFQGCPIRCRGCYVPETHDPAGGVALAVDEVVQRLLDPIGEPRDGVTVCGGEPFAQTPALVSLLRRLKIEGVHVVVYSGYTLEALTRWLEGDVRCALMLIDILIDGPFVASLAESAGEWRGSRNQRIISHPVRLLILDGDFPG